LREGVGGHLIGEQLAGGTNCTSVTRKFSGAAACGGVPTGHHSMTLF
jgi:hypothetical protein